MARLDEMACALPPLPAKLLVGVSGGADSVALVHMLALEKDRRGLQLQAVHVNHGLRGDASDGDEAFVRDLCSGLNVPLLCYRAAPPDNPGEGWARQARYGFYRKAMEVSGAEAVALAHHRDDQAETLMLHLLRGAGLEGLAGMAQDSQVLGVRVVRPLLSYARQDLRSALEEAGVTWREDASNRDSRYLRNALRNEVFPLLERLAPGAAARMAHTAGTLREASQSLEAQQETFLRTHGGGMWLKLEPVRLLDMGMRKQVLRRWWHKHGPVLDERSLNLHQTEDWAALPDSTVGKTVNLPGGWQGYRGYTHLHLLAPQGNAKPSITLERAAYAGLHGDGKRMQAMPAALADQCQVRYRQSGDWIRPFGGAGKQSLQDYMVNKRIDAPFRDAVPLLCRGSEVLLVCGAGAGDVPAVRQQDKMICLVWEGEIPWLDAKQ